MDGMVAWYCNKRPTGAGTGLWVLILWMVLQILGLFIVSLGGQLFPKSTFAPDLQNGFYSMPMFVLSFQPPMTTTMTSSRKQRLSVVQPINTFGNDEMRTTTMTTIQVWDSVFSPEICQSLHKLAQEHASRTDESNIFFRDNQQELTPLEKALDSCLTAMGDLETNVVEYWTRQEHLNMEIHSDMDEEELEEEGTLRFPQFGHVLYLQISKGLKGPTCLFPDQQGGWNSKSNSTRTTRLVTVPAVAGRVLRFSGSMMHSVPKPATRWLLDNNNDQDWVGEDDDDDYDGDDGENFDDDKEGNNMVENCRSVILFNTWKEYGPRGIGTDYSASGGLPDGMNFDYNEDVSFAKEQQRLRLEEWETMFEKNFTKLWCEPRNIWKTVNIAPAAFQQTNTATLSSDDEDSVSFQNIRVSLMGPYERRRHPRKHVDLKAPSCLRNGLDDEYQPMMFSLFL